MENDELLHKWIAGSISDEELKIFQARPEYKSLLELYKQTEHLMAPQFDKTSMLHNILNHKKAESVAKKENNQTNSSRKDFLSPWLKYGLAATALILIGIFFWPKSSTVTNYKISKGENKTGVLPDQSTFILNAESEISFDDKNWLKERKLNLSGEAYFEVKKGSTFEVYTSSGSVLVLGTHFNVYARDQNLEVSCQEGKVAIMNKLGKKMVELSAGEAVRISSGIQTKKWDIGNTNQAAWTNGIFKFRKVALKEVLQELERQFNIDIDNTDININEVITCNFQKDNLELALKTTLSPLGIKFNILQNRKVKLSKN